MKKNVASGLPNLLEFIKLNIPFTMDDIKNRIDEDSFPKFENNIWQLLELIS